MPVILQMYFDKDGPYGDEMVPHGKERAYSINEEPGFIWKIWTEDANEGYGGGIYLFDTRENAEKYNKMHTARLEKVGYRNFVYKILDVNLGLTKINKGPLSPAKEEK